MELSRAMLRSNEAGTQRLVAEIARMLAGEKVPETAMKHARTLLEAGKVRR